MSGSYAQGRVEVGDVDLVLCHHGPGPDTPDVIIPPPLWKLWAEGRRDPFLVALRREVVGRRRAGAPIRTGPQRPSGVLLNAGGGESHPEADQAIG
jgi:hypothetical protein